MANRSVEIFTASCLLCDEAIRMVRELACEKCEVTVYDLGEGCGTNECREKAAKYGVRRVPAIVVDGKLVDCCSPQMAVSRQALRKAGVGMC